MELFTIFIASFLFFNNAKEILSNPPEVSTSLGKIQGQWKKSYDGRNYASFEGIPYAKPPIGKLRFEEPQPVEPWIGIWNATQNYVCIQNSVDFSKIIGAEDCLYIDVFVPVTDKDKLDVVVHIHGGGFIIGSALEYVNPKYVMDRDIVFVTLNYRLGALGFLSTQDEIVPGNNGLKDQVLALKWVQQNIANFGGNPGSVTLTGFSAGGASVHLHYFSPVSKGLFHRGMSVSGTATSGWVFTEKAARNAKKLGALVGCPNTNTRDLVSCLKTRPAVLLTKKTKYVYEYPPARLTLFCPVLEKQSTSPFISEHPLTLLKKENVLDVPWITSVCRDDGQTLSAILLSLLNDLNEQWEEVAPHVLHNEKLFHKRDYLNKLKELYFKEEKQLTFEVFAKMITDTMFIIDAEYSAKLQSKAAKSPVYFYYFNYDQGENVLINFSTPNLKLTGVPHGKDMIYLFGGGITKKLTESDIKLKNIYLDMLYHYAKYGVPSFSGVEWKPTSTEELTFLNVTSPEDIKLQSTSDLSPAGQLWRDIQSSEDNLKDEL